jgi:hypothetical protein
MGLRLPNELSAEARVPRGVKAAIPALVYDHERRQGLFISLAKAWARL